MRRLHLTALAAVLILAGSDVTATVPDGDARARVSRWTESLDTAWRELEDGPAETAIVRFGELLEEIGGQAPGTLHHARALAGLADAQRRAGNAQTAATLYHEVVPLWQDLLGADQPRVALALYHLGLMEAAAARPEQARRALERSIAVWDRSPGDHAASKREAQRALERLGSEATPPPSE